MSARGVATAEPVGARASLALHAPERRRGARAPRPPPALLAAIYDAATAPSLWPGVLAGLAAALGGNAATLHAGPAGGPCRIAAAYLRPGRGRAARLRRPLRRARSGRRRRGGEGNVWAGPATAREAAGAGLERTAFFTGWTRQNDIGDVLCLGLLLPGAGDHATIAVARPRWGPRFGPAESALLSRLAPHLRRATEVQRRLAAAAAAPPAGPLAEALDRLAGGLALSDAGGAVVWANRSAERLLRHGDGLSLDRGGVLRASAGSTV